MNKTVKIAAALGTAGLALAAGSAFTASNTFAANATAPLTGYGVHSVSGATINSLVYNLDTATGEYVETVDLVLDGDTLTSTVGISMNNGAKPVTCAAGVYDAVATETAYVCTPTNTVTSQQLFATHVSVN